MRSGLSLLQLAMRPTFAMRIFGDVKAAAEWLTRTLQEGGSRPLSPESLTSTANELKTTFF